MDNTAATDPEPIPMNHRVSSAFLNAPGLPGIHIVHHSDASEAVSPCRPIIFCPPLFEERKSAHRAAYAIADTLATPATPVIRMDYPGTGESLGTSTDMNIALWSRALAAIASAMRDRTGCDTVTLAGLRAGALIALAAMLNSDVWRDACRPVSLILIASPPSGRTLVRHLNARSLIRQSLSTGQAAGGEDVSGASDTVDLDGYETPAAFLNDLADIDPAKMIPGCFRNIDGAFLLQLGHRTELSQDTIRLREAMGASARAQAIRIRPFWERIDDVDISPVIHALSANRDIWMP